MTYITNASAIILLLSNGEKVRVEKTDKNYAKILKTFELPKDEQESAVREITNPLSKLNDKGFSINGDTVTYQGENLPSALVTKILSIVRDGLPIEHFEKFWENLRENPSAQSVSELTDFLSYKELPITEDGYLIAYKGVKDDYFSATGNKDTRVIQGTVNEQGQIFNGVGEVIEVARNCVDDDRTNECSFGLHCGSLNYARGFASRMVLVKVNPKDVVSVPKDYSFQKCRVSKYEVLADFVEEITTSVVDDRGQDTLETIEDDTEEVNAEYDATLEKIAAYLAKKEDAGVEQVTIRQIQNIFSPNWVTRETVLNALQSLWYDWEFDEELGTDVVFLDVD
jgi:hypothetical protein